MRVSIPEILKRVPGSKISLTKTVPKGDYP
jgi:hypothetical protein